MYINFNLNNKVRFRWFKDFEGNLVVEYLFDEKINFWGKSTQSWWTVANSQHKQETESAEEYVFKKIKRELDDLNITRAKKNFVPVYIEFTEDDISKGHVKLFRNWKSK